MDDSSSRLWVADLGFLDYAGSWSIQRLLVKTRRAALVPDTLVLVEHPHTITVGRSGKRTDVLLDDASLSELGVALSFVDRGGQVTYHGPGQLVCYPILDLKPRGNDVLKYLRLLEQVIMDTLSRLGIFSRRVPGYTGVWVDEAKIASIGIKVAQGVTSHGVALNVNTDLSYFEYIIPCGLTDKEITSVEAILDKPVDMAVVSNLLVESFAKEIGFTSEPITRDDLMKVLTDA